MAAALLAGRKDLDYKLRARLITQTPAFDIQSLSEAEDAMRTAFGKLGMTSLAAFRIRERSYCQALRKTETWISRGIFAVKTGELVEHRSNHVEGVLFAWGNASLTEIPWAAILNSRKPRMIGPHEEWIEATKTLVAVAVERGFGIVSSYGTIPYALTTHMVCAENHPLLLVWDGVLPMMAGTPDGTGLPADLRVPVQGLVVSPFPPGSVPSESVRAQQRDHLVGALASLVLVAEIRPRGNMEAVLKAARNRGTTIGIYAPFASREPEAQVYAELGLKPGLVELIEPRTPAEISFPYDEPERNPQSGLLVLTAPQPGYLFHYTRACPGPWPGQTLGAYCRSLIQGDPDVAHTGFHTLVRILEEQLIRGSSRMVRGTQPVVSLTECLPWDLANLIHWRRGLARWSLELYGIGFDREFLATLGTSRVVYGDEAVFESLADGMRHLFQLSSSGSYDWASEKEWRIPGDLALNRIPRDKMIALVSNLDEARIIQARFGLPVTLADMEHVKSRGRTRQTDNIAGDEP